MNNNDGTAAAPSDIVARKSSDTVARKSSNTVAENREYCSCDTVAVTVYRKN